MDETVAAGAGDSDVAGARAGAAAGKVGDFAAGAVSADELAPAAAGFPTRPPKIDARWSRVPPAEGGE
jgi:hypothetical protein